MTIYLTIDDAPSATLDEKLDTLTARDVPALLFCEGRRLDHYIEHATRAVRAGIHLGNHTYSHPHASDLSRTEFEGEIARTERRIEAVYDRVNATRPARMFRFPYGDTGGERSDRFQRVLSDYGFTGPTRDVVRRGDERSRLHWPWTCSVEDWTTDEVSELRDRFETAIGRSPPGEREIVLFHDAGNSPALFDAFVDWSCEDDRKLRNPIDLIT